jgi:hypothetical protein
MDSDVPPPGTWLRAPEEHGAFERRLRAHFIARGVIVPGDPEAPRCGAAPSARFLGIDAAGRAAVRNPVPIDFFAEQDDTAGPLTGRWHRAERR